MICLSCPNCKAELEFADDLAGFDTACYACANPLKVPSAPPPSARPADTGLQAPAPTWTQGAGVNYGQGWQSAEATHSPQDLVSYRRPRNDPYRSSGIISSGLTVRLLIGLIIIGIGVAGLYFSGGGIYIYVDNGTEEVMVVSIDGKEEATILPGEFSKISCQPGERQIQVRAGQEVLFDGVKNLQKLDKLGANRRYLFNPDHRNRYRTYTVKYGSSPLEGLMQFKRDSTEVSERNTIRAVCRELAAEAKLLPPEPWFEVPDGALVLTPPPEYVTTKRYTETRTVLTRVDPEDYDSIVKIRDSKDPTVEDLQALLEVVDRVLDSEP